MKDYFSVDLFFIIIFVISIQIWLTLHNNNFNIISYLINMPINCRLLSNCMQIRNVRKALPFADNRLLRNSWGLFDPAVRFFLILHCARLSFYVRVFYKNVR